MSISGRQMGRPVAGGRERSDPEEYAYRVSGQGPDTDLPETTTMTIEILHLTEQIQRWLNQQVARHLAAQAAKLAR